MAELSTSYMGINLKSPLIAASSGLTDNIENIKKMEANGIGAIVLKSVFEEEILQQESNLLMEAQKDRMIYSELSETLDYIDLYIKEDTINKYLDLIKEAKKQTLLPIIASINCISNTEWYDYAKKIAKAGADAIELNIFLNPVEDTDRDVEKIYLQIAEKTVDAVSIPVSVKMSKYFTKPATIIKKLSRTGIKGMVLFNRFYAPDIDINKMEVKTSGRISQENDYLDSLRWIGLMHGRVECDLAASNGILGHETVIKQILAGASAVQICSALYEKGIDIISDFNVNILKWMEKNNFQYINQFKGRLSSSNIKDPAAYERMQFMKHFSGIE